MPKDMPKEAISKVGDVAMTLDRVWQVDPVAGGPVDDRCSKYGEDLVIWTSVSRSY